MRIYIAATSKDFEKAQALAAKLRAKGHKIMSSWHDLPGTTVSDALGWSEKLEKFNHPEIQSTDLFVALQPSHLVTGGMHVETGYALGRGISVAVVGPAQNMMLYAKLCTHYGTEEAFLASV